MAGYDLPKADEIERKSFAIIEEELESMGVRPTRFPPGHFEILRRVVHASADYDFVKNLHIHPEAVPSGLAALRSGAPVVVDVEMIRSGVNRAALEKRGCAIHCFMGDPDVADAAKRENTTRAIAAMKKAARVLGNGARPVVAVGNAPTALLALVDLVNSGALRPALVVGAPVGFVQAAESKEALLGLRFPEESAGGRRSRPGLPVPSIVARGRKGGSTVTVAIINALLRMENGGAP